MEPKFYSVKEASRKIGHSEEMIFDLIRRGKFKDIKKIRALFGEELRIPESALAELTRLCEDKGETTRSSKSKLQTPEKPEQESMIPHETLLERYEQAVHRAGWLEGQLEVYKKLVDESHQTGEMRDEELKKERESLVAREKEVEERLNQARSIEAKYKEEKVDWQKRLAAQASKISQKEAECQNEKNRMKQKDEGLQSLKAQLEALIQKNTSLTEENERMANENSALLARFKGAKKGLWSFGK